MSSTTTTLRDEGEGAIMSGGLNPTHQGSSGFAVGVEHPVENTLPPKKLGGYDLYAALGSPKYIVAPMVDQSELAWRRLSRKYGSQLVYTPMINAKMFVDETNKTYRNNNFDVPSAEEGAFSAESVPFEPSTFPVPCTPLVAASSSTAPTSNLPSSYSLNTLGDRPLIVQFCANSPSRLLASAKVVAPHCDAVDLNLGCPQDIAKKGRYGSFLMDEEDWPLIFELVNTLHQELSVPVTAKFRVFPTIEKTVRYAKMLESAGAQILTCHGRLREQRGQNTGLADWAKIRAVKQAVKVPVFANGNVLYQEDIIRCLEETGCDGVMSAEGNLYNPALFAGLPAVLDTPWPAAPSKPLVDPSHPSSPQNEAYWSNEQILVRHPPAWVMALEYIAVVRSLRTKTTASAVKGHMFKILRPALCCHTDLREMLGKARIGERPKAFVPRPVGDMEGLWEKGRRAAEGKGVGLPAAVGSKIEEHARGEPVEMEEAGNEAGKEWLWEYVDIVEELGARMERDALEATKGGAVPLRALITKCSNTGLDVIPHWLCQPYFRKSSPPPAGGG